MPSMVFMRLMPSAPASSQALAMTVISVTLGESFTMTGFSVHFLTAAVTSAAAAGSVPNVMPPPWTLGQLILTSSQPTWSHLSSLEHTLHIFVYGKSAHIGHDFL